LPCSDLTYAEASWTQGHEDWLGAHVRAFAYIGGCPKKVISALRVTIPSVIGLPPSSPSFFFG
jgi:transposase